jgi:hypothetical protein
MGLNSQNILDLSLVKAQQIIDYFFRIFVIVRLQTKPGSVFNRHH